MTLISKPSFFTKADDAFVKEWIERGKSRFSDDTGAHVLIVCFGVNNSQMGVDSEILTTFGPNPDGFRDVAARLLEIADDIESGQENAH